MSAVAQGSPHLADGGIPARVGPYTPFARVGRGGMAELFLARAETELGATRLVVIKLILPVFAGDPRFAEMLVHEAKLAAGLSHQHIVQVLDLGRDHERLYIAMEYVEGFDLNALLRRCSDHKEGLPAGHALGIVADVLEGLDYAHRRTSDAGEPLGIVHRDVSPSNILISYDGEVKLCDFGIAHANDLVRDEANEALKGKAGYMSPEHARGEPVDARSDVFAAGIILWELLAGRRLYRPRGEAPLLEQARRAVIPALPDKGLPHAAELQRIVRRALAADADERYPSAGAFHRDLEAYMAQAGLLSSRLKLGEWIEATFGTELVEERRAGERLLPKSAPPPPRSSGPIRARAAVPVEVPPAPRLPADLALPLVGEETVPLLPGVSPRETLASAPAMETAPVPPSTNAATGRSPRARPESDAELIAWARRRGVISFLFFFFTALAIATIWFFTR